MNHSGLSIGNSLLGLQLVQEHQVGKLDQDHGSKRDEDPQHRAKTWVVIWCICGVEQKRADDVACRGTGVVKRHDDRFLRCTSCVPNNPGHDEWITAEQEGKEVVASKTGSNLASGQGI